MLDTTRLLPRLHIGSAPSRGADVQRAGFDLLVLCADDHQPAISVPGLCVVRCPLDDNPYVPLPAAHWDAAIHAAEETVRQLAMGARALVTCRAGLNRSALVCALVLCLNGRTPEQAVVHIRRRRGGALNNPQFVAALMRMR